MQRVMAQKSLSRINKTEPTITEPTKTNLDQIDSSEGAKTTSGLTGIWRWKTPEGQIAGSHFQPNGMFQFKVAEGDQISGYTIAEAPFMPGNKLRSSLSIKPIEGTWKRHRVNDQDVEMISFVLKHEDGSILRNQAELSADGQRLHGKTNARVLHGKLWVKVDYSWTAERISKVG